MAAILDAFALVALALDEPAAGEVEVILRRGGSRIVAVNLAEALDQLGRVHGHPPYRLREVFEPLLAESLDMIAITEPLTWRAVELRRLHYRRRTSELSLADCFVLAAAQPEDAIVTADRPLARASRAEDMNVIGLPDTRGGRPT